MSEQRAGDSAKQAVRRQVLACRAGLSAEEVAARSQRIVERVTQLPALIGAQVVLLYASFGSELRTEGLMRWCLNTGQEVVLPKVVWQPRSLSLHVISDPRRDLEPGPWGIPEPVARCAEVAAGDLDFIVVPGVAFDVAGNRLGYGGGFYDELLDQARPELWPDGIVALALECQLVDTVPAVHKDIPVPLIVTEDRTIRTGRGR